MMHAHTRAHILQPLLIFNLRRLEVQGDGTVGVARSEDENEQIDGMVIIVEQLRAENEQLREAILHLPIDKEPMRFNGAPATCETADIGCTASPVPVSSSTMMTSETAPPNESERMCSAAMSALCVEATLRLSRDTYCFDHHQTPRDLHHPRSICRRHDVRSQNSPHSDDEYHSGPVVSLLPTNCRATCDSSFRPVQQRMLPSAPPPSRWENAPRHLYVGDTASIAMRQQNHRDSMEMAEAAVTAAAASASAAAQHYKAHYPPAVYQLWQLPLLAEYNPVHGSFEPLSTIGTAASGVRSMVCKTGAVDTTGVVACAADAFIVRERNGSSAPIAIRSGATNRSCKTSTSASRKRARNSYAALSAAVPRPPHSSNPLTSSISPSSSQKIGDPVFNGRLRTQQQPLRLPAAVVARGPQKGRIRPQQHPCQLSKKGASSVRQCGELKTVVTNAANSESRRSGGKKKLPMGECATGADQAGEGDCNFIGITKIDGKRGETEKEGEAEAMAAAGKPPKKRTKKNPKAPKRFLSSFMHFRNAKQAEVRDKLEGMAAAAAAVAVAAVTGEAESAAYRSSSCTFGYSRSRMPIDDDSTCSRRSGGSTEAENAAALATAMGVVQEGGAAEEVVEKVHQAAVIKAISEMWSHLTPQEKAAYEDLSHHDKIRYECEMKSFEGPLQVPNQRKKKDAAAPKRNMSAFLIFKRERGAAVKMQYPDMPSKDVARLMGKLWRETPEAEREPFQQQELEQRKRYLAQMAVFNREMLERQVQVEKNPGLDEQMKEPSGQEKAGNGGEEGPLVASNHHKAGGGDGCGGLTSSQ